MKSTERDGLEKVITEFHYSQRDHVSFYRYDLFKPQITLQIALR